MEQERVETPDSDTEAFPAATGTTGRAVTKNGVVYSIDREYRITSVNAAWDAFAAANGAPSLRSTRIIGTNLLDWIHGAPREEMRHLCDALLAGEIQRYDYHFDCSSSGERRVCVMTMLPVQDAQGAIKGIEFVSRNIVDDAGEQEQTGSLAMLVEQLQRQHTALERSHDHARALGHIMTTLSQSLSMHATVKTLLSTATDLVQAPAAAVYLLSNDGDYLIPYGSHGMDLEGSDPGVFMLATSVAGRVLKQRAPQEIRNTTVTPELQFPRFSDGTMPHSLYVVPISTYEGPIGVLEVYSRTARSFDQDERSLLIALAATAGIAMTNARLFDEQVRAREEAEQLAHVAAEQAAQLHATLAAMTDGVWICDRSGMIVSVNDAGLHMFGLERSDVVDQPVSVLADLLEVGRGERRRLGLRLALQGETIHAECDVCPHSTNADLTVDIRTTPIRDEMGSVIGAVAVIRDITESKVMERLKEDFLSVAAHELKTPITALKGYTQLALKRTPSSEAQSTHRALRTIDQQADRITKLVQKLLDVSRIQSGHLELQLAQFDLQELIMSVAERARLVAPSHIIDVEPHVPLMVRADHERLEQVIFNLVDNAIKYSPKGEKIQMSADIVGDEVWVSVHDWGVGIPDDKLPHIFERWYQAHLGTHGDYGGMGLGLYISKEIVEQHNGRMWAVSSEAEGTVIGFVLPLDPGQPAGPVPEHA